ncbi:MAG: response regulator [Deltaproteobacteria bacterium]|nr:response regulator [Deltaproteobacteria bacterium]
MSRILVVEDDPDVQAALKAHLESIGQEVISARNGVEGVRKALTHYPDVMTLDLEMPYMNGFQTLRVLNLIHITVPVILISQSKLPDGHQDLFRHMVGICSKTNLWKELPSALLKALSTSQAPRVDMEFPVGREEIVRLASEGGRKRVLVVDDEPENLSAVVWALEQTGLYDVFTAGGGQEALFKAVVLNPDLMVCDVMMPQLDGITLAQLLYTLGRPLPMVYLSTNTQESIVRQAMKLDCVRGYLFKQDLLTMLGSFLAKVEEWTHTTPEQKEQWANAYQSIDLEKLTHSGRELGLFTGGGWGESSGAMTG